MTRALTNIISPSSERYFRKRPIDLIARVDFLQISLMWLLNDKLLCIITPRFLAFFVMIISVKCLQVPVQNPAVDTWSRLVVALKQTLCYFFLPVPLGLLPFGVLWGEKLVLLWTQVFFVNEYTTEIKKRVWIVENKWYHKSKTF